MRRSLQLAFAALTAALLLASAVATTSARNFSVTNQNIRATWSSLEFSSSLVTTRCQVTLEGSFHTRTVAKVQRTLIGAVTRVSIKRPCTNGEAWAANGLESHPRLGRLNNTLPWGITYEGFGGRLPTIESILILARRARYVIHSAFNTLCLYGTETDNITGRSSREPAGAITSLVPVEGRNTITLVAELGTSGFCPATARFGGTGQPFLLNTSTRITITLI
jgi:hypothetical protein